MKNKASVLVAAFVLSFVMSAGARTVMASETEAAGQTGTVGQTEAAGQTDTVGQTEAEDQTETAGETGSGETQEFYVPEEPSDKRGLQSEEGYLFYYKSNGYLQTGWKKINKKLYYFRKDSAEGPRGSAAVGLVKIGSYGYYFNAQGVLQTGWQTVAGQRYYGTKTGSNGKLGRLYTGLHKIGKKRYYFDASGAMQTGWITYKSKKYYFEKKTSSENYGAAYTGWHTIDGSRYYFTSAGVMKKNCWISKKYYVGADGAMLKNTVTPNGYLVDSNGLKGKRASGFIKVDGKMYYYQSGKRVTGLKKIGKNRYYFDEDGVRKEEGWLDIGSDRYYIEDGVIQTGWVACDGRRYYFSSRGKLQKNKTVDGITLGEDGSASLAVLIIAGHGQGDCGAFQTYGKTTYYEENLTREFSTLIYNNLTSIAPGISVTMYDQNYNLYKVLSGSAGPKPDFKAYDYILEVHFNALADKLKDPKGDGKCYGTGMYVNSAKKNTKIDEAIVAAVAKAGKLPIWGGGTGIMRSSGLLNARTIQGKGVSYGLLETAFIDDRDDWKHYKNNKKAMALAAATAIKDYFGV